MGSDSALAQHWEKIVLVVAIAVFGAAAFFSLGYFKIKEPSAEIGELGERYSEAVGRVNTSSPTEELIGRKRMEAALDPAAGALPAPVWSFYNYMGVDLRMSEEIVEARYCPPNLEVSATVAETTGEVTITFVPPKGSALPPRGSFIFEIFRYVLAAGKETATLLTASDSFVFDLKDSVGTPPPGSKSPPLVFGTSYVYFGRIKLNEDVLLGEGCQREAETAAVEVTTLDRFKVSGFRKDGSKYFLSISSIDAELPTTEVRVTQRVLKDGAPVETAGTAATAIGEFFPLRPEPGSQYGKHFKYHDLQRSFFDFFYTRRSTAKEVPAVVDPGGETPGEDKDAKEGESKDGDKGGMKEDGAPPEKGDKPKGPPTETSDDTPTKPKTDPDNPFK